MKEKLYTIPLNDAVNAADECPFCHIEREIEQDLLDYVLGSCSSYMESDTREKTDEAGFCRMHYQKMFQYGNTLGNAWILKTHFKKRIAELERESKRFSAVKSSLSDRLRGKTGAVNSMTAWVREKEDSCYICGQFRDTYARYLDTFFYLWQNDPEFVQKIENGKGFCLPHFGDLCEAAQTRLNEKQQAQFYPLLFSLMKANLERIGEDVSWMVEKFDYRNKDADWKNSRDAIQRGMQKMAGGYPADPVYKMNK